MTPRRHHSPRTSGANQRAPNPTHLSAATSITRTGGGEDTPASLFPDAEVASPPAVADAGPVFARHETFAPRAGWLKKGFDAAAENSLVFLGDGAAGRLGVGKNMARAIRYWCHATKLLDDAPVRGQRALASRPSELGQALLGADGWDPYLEDVGSLWYLHWKLVEAPSLATAWRFAFTQFPEREFSADHLQHALQAFVARMYPGARAAATSLRKDVLCIVRMYVEAQPRGPTTEETIASPFAELGLIQAGADPRTLLFDVGEKGHLPAPIVVAACLEYCAAAAPGRRTIAIGRLLFDPGSPGMAFKLSESALAAAIESVERATGCLTIADTAGLVQLSIDGEPLLLARDLLNAYYTSAARLS